MSPGPAGSAAFLFRLRDTPALMDPAPAGVTGQQMDHRANGETRQCLRCPDRARIALIARTTSGPRWLDLCPPCWMWCREANEIGRDPVER